MWGIGLVCWCLGFIFWNLGHACVLDLHFGILDLYFGVLDLYVGILTYMWSLGLVLWGLGIVCWELGLTYWVLDLYFDVLNLYAGSQPCMLGSWDILESWISMWYFGRTCGVLNLHSRGLELLCWSLGFVFPYMRGVGFVFLESWTLLLGSWPYRWCI